MAARPGRGSMSFTYKVVRLSGGPAEELLAAELGVVPLAMLGRLPENVSLEDGSSALARRVVERITTEALPERAKKLLTDRSAHGTAVREPRGGSFEEYVSCKNRIPT